MKILIENLKVITGIGISREEREQYQEILMNIECEVDFSRAMVTDSIDDTVDYRKLAETIRDFCKKHSFHLLEKLGGKLLELLFEDFPGIKAIRIQIFKTKAIKEAERTGIEIYRVREGNPKQGL